MGRRTTRSWNEAIAKIRSDIKARKTEHDLHKAQRAADRAEDDAGFAIDFAYSAVVQAEYAVLDATLGGRGRRRGRREYAHVGLSAVST